MLLRVPALRQPVREREKRGDGDKEGEKKDSRHTPPPPLTHARTPPHTPLSPFPHYSNNEVSFTGAFGERGTRTSLAVPAGAPDILSRQLVKAETATASVPELEFEIPAGTQKGCITTVEGLLREAADKLRALQPERRAANPEAGAAIDAFLAKLDAAAASEAAFTLVLDDPAGNSGVESAGPGDPLVSVVYYDRTPEQAAACGLKPGEVRRGAEEREGGTRAHTSARARRAEGWGEARDPFSSHPPPFLRLSLPPSQAPQPPPSTHLPEISADDPHHGPTPLGAAAAHKAFARLHGPAAEALMSRYTAPEEVLVFPGHCGACGGATETRVYQTSIPFFKEVILMADSCDACGYKNAEVKGGGGIPEKGRRLELKVTTPGDLRRDVIKAETARVAIPELDLEVSTGSLGGLITTVEGVALAVRDSLQSTQTFQLGDAAGGLDPSSLAWKTFYEGLAACAAGERPWTLVMTDPLANSFISGPPGTGPGEEADPAYDPGLVCADYTRSAEEDEEYGIDHLRAHAATNAAGGGGVEEGIEEEGEEAEAEVAKAG